MLDTNDVKVLEGAIERVVEKQLDVFGAVVDQKIEKQLDAFGAVMAVSFSEIRIEFANVHKRIDILTTHVDEFIHLYQKIDQEMTMVHARIDRLEEQIKLLQAHLA